MQQKHQAVLFISELFKCSKSAISIVKFEVCKSNPIIFNKITFKINNKIYIYSMVDLLYKKKE